MASLAQKHKALPRLAGAYSHFLFFRGPCDRRVPQEGFLQVAGSRCSSPYQNTDHPILATLYEPLPKQLISVLGDWRPKFGRFLVETL
jgi:hypothetical protein